MSVSFGLCHLIHCANRESDRKVSNFLILWPPNLRWWLHSMKFKIKKQPSESSMLAELILGLIRYRIVRTFVLRHKLITQTGERTGVQMRYKSSGNQHFHLCAEVC